MKSIKQVLVFEKTFEDKIYKLHQRIVEAGYECYMVGGSIRDLILGHTAYDFDFATNARPEQISRLFRHVAPTGIKHGTVTVFIEKVPFEVTTYRCDGKYVDGRRPDTVTFSKTLKEDIIRRDFTINGLAYDIGKQELLDYVGGIADLERSLITTIGDPNERLSEDGLRSYRACRFAAKLMFTIDKKTLAGIRETLHIAEKVSVERVRDELLKMMASEKPSVGIEYMRETGLLKIAIPELDACYEVEQNRFHKYDIYYHCVYSCDAASADDVLIRFAALLHDIGKVPCRARGADGDYTFYNHEIVGARMTRALMRRLKFSNDDIDRVINLVSNHMFYYTKEWTDGAVRRFIRKVGLENLDDLIKLRMADRVGNGSRHGQAQPIFRLQEHIERIVEQENAFSVRDLRINGTDLINECGCSQGPQIGEVLHHLLDLVLEDPQLNEYEALKAHVVEYLESKKTD
ncbi:MAG: CCA tRNA nucleotidyltransferase [Spirochaetes bacterium]|jgi:tRNA nucleotidyltransferase (CCA-adding enzyme)|nr:CCA tRNA nucleotidyltransferase [Spirochaetota bacterium]